MSVGILTALIAMVSWGFGDFLIQRSTRKIGDWETLFLITLFGSIVLLPFVWNTLPDLITSHSRIFLILLAAGVLLFIAALLEFEALKTGKLSIIEPTWSLEIPTAALFAVLILQETITTEQVFFIGVLIIGLILVSYRGKILNKNFFLEKGVKVSIIAALLMGATNFFVGWGARETDPLTINFFINLFSLVGSGVFLLVHGQLKNTVSRVIRYPKTILPMMILDNGAWIAFAFAMTLAPIAITVALSESYIIIAVLLGIILGKEKLEHHQKVGLLISIVSAITLSIFL